MALREYDIDYKKPAEKFFRKHEDVRQKYEADLAVFLTDESSARVDVKNIKGKRCEYYRMRIGSWRVIFMIADGKITVVNTILAGSRGDIYKKIGGLN
ncbi:MAG: hypothetical protein IJP86_02340 [Synergistaceae bacterium]|nr:hypothetical protein [Synergistaceae bacterium]